MVLKGRRFKEARFPGLLMSMRLFPLNELELTWDPPHHPLPFLKRRQARVHKSCRTSGEGSVKLGHPKVAWREVARLVEVTL